MNFLQSIKERAKQDKKTIVLPEAGDIRTLKAAGMALSEGIANVILLGEKDKIMQEAKSINCDLSRAEIINPVTYKGLDGIVAKFVELRKSKGMTEEEAVKLLAEDPHSLYFGCMLIKEGLADGMVAGAVNSTSNVMRSALQIVKTAPGTKLVSAFFVMCVPDCEYGRDGVFIFADSGLNQNPNAEELSAIAISSAKSFKQLVGAEPNVAMLSHSTKGSAAKHPDIEKVVEAVKLAKEAAPEMLIDGELQLDAAIVPSIGVSKAPGSSVAGKANVLVFPDLDTGNIAYKIVERLAKAEAYGPITQGIARPVNDLSRGCTAEDIVGVMAITAVQAVC